MPRIAWQDEYHARRDPDRPTWIHFTAGGCAPCAAAKRLLEQPEVIDASQGLACVRIESASPSAPHPRALEYGVRAFPTDCFVPAGTRELTTFVGAPATAEQYSQRLRQAAERSIVVNRGASFEARGARTLFFLPRASQLATRACWDCR